MTLPHMTEVEWVGEEKRFIPNGGIAEKGKRMTIPTKYVDSYMKQGLCKILSTAPVKVKEDKEKI